MVVKTDRRVLRVITRLNVGGPARHVLILNRELPQLGFPSSLLAGSVGLDEGEIIDPAVPVDFLPTLGRKIAPFADASVLRSLIARFRTEKPTIVHTHMAKAGALGRMAAARAGVPVTVHTFHGHVLDGYFSRSVSSAFLAIERRLAARTSALVAVSEAIRDQLLDLGIGKPEQWRVIPLGLDLDPLLDLPLPKVSSLSRIGIVGRLTAIKNHKLFLEAASILASSNPSVRFVVVGDGELRGELEVKAHRALGDRVEFTGWQSNLERLYSELDVVVLTSDNEGTPVALIEAAAAGKPCVATDVGGVRDVVRHGSSGLVVPPGDARVLADAIDSLVDDPELAFSMGAAGRSWVCERFMANRLVGDIAALYDELIKDRSRSGR